YPCCSPGAEVVYTDESGDWGVENGDWCGIEKEQPQSAACWSAPYPCCKGNTVVYTDEQGDWGVENNEWCGI
ncbi:Non-catalytic module family DOC2, partial [Piromyces sp. E2]